MDKLKEALAEYGYGEHGQADMIKLLAENKALKELVSELVAMLQEHRGHAFEQSIKSSLETHSQAFTFICNFMQDADAHIEKAKQHMEGSSVVTSTTGKGE